MILTINTPPAKEPVSLDEAKDHLRVSHSDDDSRIGGYVTAARNWAEAYLGRALITQTWDMWCYSFPYGDGEIEFPKAPLQSVSAVTYTDTDGATQTWASSNYTVDANSHVGRLYLGYGKTWPGTRSERKAVKLTFIAGYGDDADDIPRPIIEGMLLHMQILYEQPINFERDAIESARDALLSPYRVWTL